MDLEINLTDFVKEITQHSVQVPNSGLLISINTFYCQRGAITQSLILVSYMPPLPAHPSRPLVLVACLGTSTKTDECTSKYLSTDFS